MHVRPERMLAPERLTAGYPSGAEPAKNANSEPAKTGGRERATIRRNRPLQDTQPYAPGALASVLSATGRPFFMKILYRLASVPLIFRHAGPFIPERTVSGACCRNGQG